ncbi:MAG: YqeG family HAD IIIA-type phosphatase [Coriobacteriales bacterium]|nr:YqeG family HAD IIIA-type phosphatase [Coriobacteriales bacterium]
MSVVRASKYAASVDLIDVDDLVEQGVRLVLLDRDNTLVPRDAKVAPPAVSAWLDRLREANIALCMVSNNFHSDAVCRSASELGLEVVHHAMKPSPVALWVAMQMMGVPAEQTVLVGDQLFTDVMAGNFAGVRTILVRPQSRKDLWYTQLFRVAENVFLRGAVFEGEER